LKKYKYRIEIELNDKQQFQDMRFIMDMKRHLNKYFEHQDVYITYVNDLFLVQSNKYD
jgi:hypothetical protein